MTTPDNEPDDDGPSMVEGLALSGLAAFSSLVVVLFIGAVVYGIAYGRPSDERRAELAMQEAVSDEAGQIQVGEQVYASACASCHGRLGEGGVGPSFAGVTTRLPDVADQIQVVVEGRGQMPAFGASLTDEQIEAVIAYERTVLDGP